MFSQQTFHSSLIKSGTRGIESSSESSSLNLISDIFWKGRDLDLMINIYFLIVGTNNKGWSSFDDTLF